MVPMYAGGDTATMFCNRIRSSAAPCIKNFNNSTSVQLVVSCQVPGDSVSPVDSFIGRKLSSLKHWFIKMCHNVVIFVSPNGVTECHILSKIFSIVKFVAIGFSARNRIPLNLPAINLS